MLALTHPPTTEVSYLIKSFHQPFCHSMSHIKDDWALGKLSLCFKYDCELYSCDIKSLYTNISHDLGMKVLEFWINKHEDKIQQEGIHLRKYTLHPYQ